MKHLQIRISMECLDGVERGVTAKIPEEMFSSVFALDDRFPTLIPEIKVALQTLQTISGYADDERERVLAGLSALQRH